MQFYLNQKSLPMIRKCGNCVHFNSNFETCSLIQVVKAYDHTKKIYPHVSENLFCKNHEFKNEEVLRQQGMIVEYDSVQDAVNVIERAKAISQAKRVSEL